MAAPPSGTVTLLFSDIEGSTRILRRVGDAYPELLERHRALLSEAFERHGGAVLGTEGDGFFVAFESATDAAAAAADGQRALAGHEWPEGNEIRVRMGLHTGEPRAVDGGYVGLDVHQAARVMAAGHGGQVLVTEATRALLGDELRLRDLGEQLLKDLAGPLRLYQLELDGLPGEFPPLNALDHRFARLPTVPSSFVGRERELAELAELLAREDVRLLTLIGPGGTGKTRLALRLATAASERFGNGAAFVQLSPIRDPELVLPAIAQALGLREQPGETALETLGEYLRRRELLLVLDNFEQVLGAATALAGLLAEAPGLKVLATSRTPLRLSGEHAYRVPQLAPAESVELFVERASNAAAGFELSDENAEAIAAICRRLDGLPLAIELAAPRVRTLTPQALLRRLDQRLPLLTGGAQDADERQRTLRDTIAWSYDLLPEREQAVFRRLGVFVGGFRLEAAAAIGGSAEILDDLDSLVEQSLLLRLREDSDGEPRFWMLETIREYALEQLDAADELAAGIERHGSWFAELAECLDAEGSGDQPASVARLVDDYPNLRAAIERARERGDGELLLRLATALWTFWSTRGYVAEGRRALEDALELSDRRPARALLGLSSLRVFSGSSDGLLDDVHEALRAAEELGDPLTLAQAWNLLGRVEGTLLGSLGKAEEAWQQALVHAERGDLRAERAESIGWLMMAANFGPLPVEDGIVRCRRFHDEAVDDPFIRGNARVEQGALEAMRGNFELARGLVADGLETIAGLGFSLRAAMSMQEAFYVEMLAGELEAAERIGRDAYATLERMGERGYLSTAAALLAHVLAARDELDEAERFSRTSEDAAAADDAFSQILWRSARAKIRARRGELAEAESLAREAVALAEATDLLNTQGDTLADLGEVLALAGRRDEAAAVLGRAAETLERKGNLASLALVRRAADAAVGSRHGRHEAGSAPFHRPRRRRRAARPRSVRAARRVRARPAGAGADRVPGPAQAAAAAGHARPGSDRGHRSRPARGGLPREAGDPSLPGQHGPPRPGARLGRDRGVRRRRRARLARGRRRGRPAQAHLRPARLRRDEGQGPRRRALEALRRAGRGGARSGPPDARRRRLGAGARGVPGAEARAQGQAARRAVGLALAGRALRLRRDPSEEREQLEQLLPRDARDVLLHPEQPLDAVGLGELDDHAERSRLADVLRLRLLDRLHGRVAARAHQLGAVDPLHPAGIEVEQLDHAPAAVLERRQLPEGEAAVEEEDEAQRQAHQHRHRDRSAQRDREADEQRCRAEEEDGDRHLFLVHPVEAGFEQLPRDRRRSGQARSSAGA